MMHIIPGSTQDTDLRERDERDAARWRFVRDNMIRSHGKVDGSTEVYFCFAASIGYGVSATDAVDRRIKGCGS